MTLTLRPILTSAGIDPSGTLVIRHAFVSEHEDGAPGIQAGASDEEILEYTGRQSADRKGFPAEPPPVWVVFIREDGNGARLWSVVDNRGETSSDGTPGSSATCPRCRSAASHASTEDCSARSGPTAR